MEVLLLPVGEANGQDHNMGQAAAQHLIAVFIDEQEVVVLHGLTQPVVNHLVDFAQSGPEFMVCDHKGSMRNALCPKDWLAFLVRKGCSSFQSL